MYGVHPTPRPPASFSKYCRKVFTLDLDRLPPEQSVDRLRNIARGIGAKPLLMPTNDESALFVAHNASQLQDVFVFPANPVQVVWSLYNKKDMCLLAKRLSIPTPDTVFLSRGG
jgi:predicted ATP-grasp superfamily ATP-dependent carboligase